MAWPQPHIVSGIVFANVPFSGPIELLPPLAATQLYAIQFVQSFVNASTFTTPNAAASQALAQGLNGASLTQFYQTLFGWGNQNTLFVGQVMNNSATDVFLLTPGNGLWLVQGNPPTNGGLTINLRYALLTLPLQTVQQAISQ